MTRPRDDLTPRLLTPAEAAAYLGVCTKTLRGLRADGIIPAVIVGRGTKRPRRRYAVKDLDRFIAERTRQEPPSEEPAPCPSGRKRAARSTATISGSQVIDFKAARARRSAARRNARNSASGKSSAR